MLTRSRPALTLFLILSFLVPRSLAAEGEAERPRLVVLMVFDQMRGDYPARWHDQFGADGFKRLQKEGMWFKNCHYPYANTITAAGHTSLVTGCSPHKHGIVGNSWYDRESKTVVASTEYEKYRQVPPPVAEVPKDVKVGVSPENRLQKTVADMLHDATKGKGKVVSLSIKARAAALMANLMAHLAYWFSEFTGGFVTSSFYRDTEHDWVERFNREEIPDRYFGKEWDRLRPLLDYDKLAGPDDGAGEAKALDLGKTFPHPITGGLKKPGTKFYDALTATPMGNEVLLQFAKRAIVAEKLGQDETADLLLLSFSSNDLVGHLYGPDSHEVLDVTLRTDELIGDFLKFLDKKVGAGKYAVVISSDHGICPLPEAVGKEGKASGRISPKRLGKDAEDFLQTTFKESERPYVEEFVSPWFYLDRRTLAELKIEPAEVEKKLADWLVTHPLKPIQAAYTRTELIKGMPKDKLGQMVWRSYHPDRCGDVVLVTSPYYFVTPYLTGTTHGTPHEYDTHVPLFVLGPGIRTGTSDEAVTPQAAAAILAHFLGVDPPPGAEAPVPKSLR